jgi:mevalonate kinase
MAIPAVQLTVEADLPAGRGLSSSAAFCVAVLDALARHAGCRLEGRELAALATHVERDLLGVACGPLDPIACVSREPILLRWASNGAVSIEAIHPAQTLHLVVASFAAPRNTPAILRALQEHASGAAASGLDPEAVDAVGAALATFAAEAEQGSGALQAGDAAALGLSMDRCQ